MSIRPFIVYVTVSDSERLSSLLYLTLRPLIIKCCLCSSTLWACTHRAQNTHDLAMKFWTLHWIDWEWNDYILLVPSTTVSTNVIGESCCVVWVYLLCSLPQNDYLIWYAINDYRIEMLDVGMLELVRFVRHIAWYYSIEDRVVVVCSPW